MIKLAPVALFVLLNAALYAAQDDTVIYPTIKGTTIPDRSKPIAIIRNGVAYPPIKGTTVPDTSKPAYNLEDWKRPSSVEIYATEDGDAYAESVADY